MLQRIQSIYLFLAGACGLSTLSGQLPFGTYSGDRSILAQSPSHYLGDGILDVHDSGVLLAIPLLAGLLSLVAIFLFRQRMRQLQVARTALIGYILLPLVAVALLATQVPVTWDILPGLGIGAVLLGILFLVLAIRGIRKDDRLIRSMDRLR